MLGPPLGVPPSSPGLVKSASGEALRIGYTGRPSRRYAAGSSGLGRDVSGVIHPTVFSPAQMIILAICRTGAYVKSRMRRVACVR